MNKNHIPLNGKDDEFIKCFNAIVDELEKPRKPVTMDDLFGQMSPYAREEFDKAAMAYVKEHGGVIRNGVWGFLRRKPRR